MIVFQSVWHTDAVGGSTGTINLKSKWMPLNAALSNCQRVPFTDNMPGSDMPWFRNIWENVRSKMLKKDAEQMVATAVPCLSTMIVQQIQSI